MATSEEVLRVYTPPADPRQQRLIAIRAEIKTLEKERAYIKESLLQHGTCEVCGATFTRRRTNKRYCSQKCTIKHSMQNRHVRWDYDTIANNLDLLEASGQLKPHVMEMVKAVIRDGKGAATVADEAGLSRERVGQYLGRATVLCRMLVAIRDSIIKASVPEGSAA